MDGIFLWLMGGVAGLLSAAAVVAGWEHLRRSVRPQDEFASATPKVVSVDLRLDRLTAKAAPAAPVVATHAQPGGDMGQRRAALDQVLARMALPLSADDLESPRFWADTTPTVGPGQLEPHDPVVSTKWREFGASQQP